MKKTVSLILVILMMLSTVLFTLTSCKFFDPISKHENKTNKYLVSFDTNGGNEIEAIYVEEGKCFAVP